MFADTNTYGYIYGIHSHNTYTLYNSHPLKHMQYSRMEPNNNNNKNCYILYFPVKFRAIEIRKANYYLYHLADGI